MLVQQWILRAQKEWYEAFHDACSCNEIPLAPIWLRAQKKSVETIHGLQALLIPLASQIWFEKCEQQRAVT